MFVFAPGNGVHPLCLDGIVYITLPYSQYEMWRQVAVRCDAVYFGPDDAYLSEQEQEQLKEFYHWVVSQGIPVYTDTTRIHPHQTTLAYPEQSYTFMEKMMKGYRTYLDKSLDYSPMNILGTGEIGLVTRTWDKIARLMNLMGFYVTITGMEYDAPHKPKNESIDDTWMDLAVYGINAAVYRAGKWGK